jgi:hypothetical protein
MFVELEIQQVLLKEIVLVDFNIVHYLVSILPYRDVQTETSGKPVVCICMERKW